MYWMAREVVCSRHARQRKVLRGISTAEVEIAIQLGSKTHQGGKVASAYRYFEVVYVVRRSRTYVITVKPRW